MFDQSMIDERVIHRAMEEFPNIDELVPFSTPVVSFGNPQTAEMVTVGINPSSLEFLEGKKVKKLLKPESKRLIDTEILNLKSPKSLSKEEAISVITGCYQYFDKNPYEWFNHLEKYANNYFGYSYFRKEGERQSSAAHLDLVQWATDPVWGGINNLTTRQNLLKSDVSFLRYQINSKQFKVVFLNGDQVTKHVTDNKILQIHDEIKIAFKTKNGSNTSIKAYKGVTPVGSKVFGWSRPFPGHRINSEEFPRVMEAIYSYFSS